MRKTGQQFEQTVYDDLVTAAASFMGSYPALDGGVYRSGLRPKDSTKEDVVVTFVEANRGQVQTALVHVALYVPDIVVYEDGTLRPNKARLAQVEECAEAWLCQFGGRIDVDVIDAPAVASVTEKEINQHYVLVPFKFNLFTD